MYDENSDDDVVSVFPNSRYSLLGIVGCLPHVSASQAVHSILLDSMAKGQLPTGAEK